MYWQLCISCVLVNSRVSCVPVSGLIQQFCYEERRPIFERRQGVCIMAGVFRHPQCVLLHTRSFACTTLWLCPLSLSDVNSSACLACWPHAAWEWLFRSVRIIKRLQVACARFVTFARCLYVVSWCCRQNRLPQVAQFWIYLCVSASTRMHGNGFHNRVSLSFVVLCSFSAIWYWQELFPSLPVGIHVWFCLRACIMF